MRVVLRSRRLFVAALLPALVKAVSPEAEGASTEGVSLLQLRLAALQTAVSLGRGKQSGGEGTSPLSLQNCTTREDPRGHQGKFTKAAKPGTPCLFGVDARDEGAHCIATQPGKDANWGSFGWCWTDDTHSTWGICSQGCPMAGFSKLLGAKLDRVDNHLDRLKAAVIKRMEAKRNATKKN